LATALRKGYITKGKYRYFQATRLWRWLKEKKGGDEDEGIPNVAVP
jgi:hypothetical protein